MSPIADFFSRIDFYDIFRLLIDGGWYHYLFPFLLVYAIVLTILNKVEVFKDYKPIKVIISTIFALFAIAFPITDRGCYSGWYTSISPGCTLGDYMIVLFPGVTAFAIAVLALYIVAAMMGVDLMHVFKDKDGNVKPVMKYIIFGIGAIVVVFYTLKTFGGLDGYSGFWLWDLLSDPFLYMLLLFSALFIWISSGDKPNDTEEDKINSGAK